jgi:AraC family transcriptional regulator
MFSPAQPSSSCSTSSFTSPAPPAGRPAGCAVSGDRPAWAPCDPRAGVPPATSGGWPRPVRRAVDYIEAHLHEPVNVAELAGAACMSRFHFARTFRASTGCSPMEYLRLRRIAVAQQMLRDGRHKVCQIASELCFFDQSHFIRSFRRITGCTPTRFAAACASAGR